MGKILEFMARDRLDDEGDGYNKDRKLLRDNDWFLRCRLEERIHPRELAKIKLPDAERVKELRLRVMTRKWFYRKGSTVERPAEEADAFEAYRRHMRELSEKGYCVRAGPLYDMYLRAVCGGFTITRDTISQCDVAEQDLTGMAENREELSALLGREFPACPELAKAAMEEIIRKENKRYLEETGAPDQWSGYPRFQQVDLPLPNPVHLHLAVVIMRRRNMAGQLRWLLGLERDAKRRSFMKGTPWEMAQKVYEAFGYRMVYEILLANHLVSTLPKDPLTEQPIDTYAKLVIPLFFISLFTWFPGIGAIAEMIPTPSYGSGYGIGFLFIPLLIAWFVVPQVVWALFCKAWDKLYGLLCGL